MTAKAVLWTYEPKKIVPVISKSTSMTKERNFSQRDFCKLTGYSENNLSNFLIGKTTNPRIDLIEAFTAHFPDLSINWLFTGQGSMWLTEDGLPQAIGVGEEEVPEKDPKNEMLKEELLAMYKDKTKMLEEKVRMLEREIKTNCDGLAKKLEI